jgi:hypothetical protein
MAGLEDTIKVNYEQLGPIRPAGVRDRLYPDCREFLIIHLLKKWMGIKFWTKWTKVHRIRTRQIILYLQITNNWYDLDNK